MTKFRSRTAMLLAVALSGLAIAPARAEATTGPLHGCQPGDVCIYVRVNFNGNTGPTSSWAASSWLAGCNMVDLGSPINMRNDVESVVNNTGRRYTLLDHRSANHSADVGLGLMAPGKAYSRLGAGNNKADEIVGSDCI